MKKLLLAMGLLLLPGTVHAAESTCTATPTCESLGYTQTSTECSGKTSVVCPFDKTKYFCDSAIIGEIRIWPTSTPPKGWLLCDGSAVSRTKYAKLYAVIGSTFGQNQMSPNSDPKFYLPNLIGRVPIGEGFYSSIGDYTFDYELGETGGGAFMSLTADNIPDHKHLIPWGENSTTSAYAPWGYISGKFKGSGDTDTDNKRYYSGYHKRGPLKAPPTSKDGIPETIQVCKDDRTFECRGTPFDNRMPYLALNFIIFTGVYD